MNSGRDITSRLGGAVNERKGRFPIQRSASQLNGRSRSRTRQNVNDPRQNRSNSASARSSSRQRQSNVQKPRQLSKGRSNSRNARFNGKNQSNIQLRSNTAVRNPINKNKRGPPVVRQANSVKTPRRSRSRTR